MSDNQEKLFVTTRTYDGLPLGAVVKRVSPSRYGGIIVEICDLRYAYLGHDAETMSNRRLKDKYYYLPDGILAPATKADIRLAKSTSGIVRCTVCGQTLPMYRTIRNSYGEHICAACMDTKSYSTRNEKKKGCPTRIGYTFGFEFEAVPKSSDAFSRRNSVANMIGNKWEFIPTRDCSLPSGGIEFKSPIIQNRRALMSMFRAADCNLDFSNDHCGQHINIGNTRFLNADSMYKIRHNAPLLFDALVNYMKAHRASTKNVCGRYFGEYRRSSGFTHGSWINLDHDSRIEFRISKFVSPEQYYNLVNMWVDMMECINDMFLVADDTNKCSQELVNIFKDYAVKAKKIKETT